MSEETFESKAFIKPDFVSWDGYLKTAFKTQFADTLKTTTYPISIINSINRMAVDQFPMFEQDRETARVQLYRKLSESVTKSLSGTYPSGKLDTLARKLVDCFGELVQQGWEYVLVESTLPQVILCEDPTSTIKALAYLKSLKISNYQQFASVLSACEKVFDAASLIVWFYNTLLQRNHISSTDSQKDFERWADALHRDTAKCVTQAIGNQMVTTYTTLYYCTVVGNMPFTSADTIIAAVMSEETFEQYIYYYAAIINDLNAKKLLDCNMLYYVAFCSRDITEIAVTIKAQLGLLTQEKLNTLLQPYVEKNMQMAKELSTELKQYFPTVITTLITQYTGRLVLQETRAKLTPPPGSPQLGRDSPILAQPSDEEKTTRKRARQEMQPEETSDKQQKLN